MYVQCILRSKTNPRQPPTIHNIRNIYEVSEAKKAVKAYIGTLQRKRLIVATLMNSAHCAERTLYREGTWYY